MRAAIRMFWQAGPRFYGALNDRQTHGVGSMLNRNKAPKRLARFGAICLSGLMSASACGSETPLESNKQSGATAVASGRAGPAPSPGAVILSQSTTVRGRVISVDGAPLRRALVRWNSADREALTRSDEAGRYTAVLEAGTYVATASKRGHVDLQYGQLHPSDIATIVTIGVPDGPNEFDFYLPRAGAIDGQVVDEFGEPVPDVAVEAVFWDSRGPPQRQQPGIRVRPRTQSLSDTTGSYRIDGLLPGRYDLAISAAGETHREIGTEDTFAYGKVAYSELSGGATVEVRAGENAVVRSAIRPVRHRRVYGRVMLSTGVPAQEGFVRIREVETAPGHSPRTAVAPIRGADGAFWMSIPVTERANYEISVTAGRPWIRPGVQRDVEATVRRIAGDALINLSLQTAQGATLSGHVVFDHAGARPSFSGLRVYVVPTEGESRDDAVPASAQVDTTGAFEISNVFGSVELKLSADGYTVSRVMRNGMALDGSRISATSGERMTGLSVYLSANEPISGVVVDGLDEPAPYAVVAVIHDAREQPQLRQIEAVTIANASGRWSIPVSSGGSYTVVASRRIVPAMSSVRAFLLSPRSQKYAVVVSGLQQRSNVRLTIE